MHAFGGRAAEDLVFEKYQPVLSVIWSASRSWPYSMVTVYGMNKEIGNISFYDSKQSEYSFNKPYSEATSEKIDQEVKKIIDSAFERTKKLLSHHREKLEIIAKELLEKEILFQSDLERLIGKRPFAHQTTYEKFYEWNS